MKRLLHLPCSTPGYLLRLKTGSTRLDVEIAKRALKFWMKILSMSEDRYPKIMYNRLKNSCNTVSTPFKLNWTVQLRSLLRITEHDYLWEHEDVEMTKLAIPIIEGILAKLSWKGDRVRATSSTYCPLYKEIKNFDSLHAETYLKLALSMTYVRLFAACRLAGCLSVTLNYNKINYRIYVSEPCLLCNMNAMESLNHIITECPMYESLRVNYLNASGLLEILNYNDRVRLTKFFYFISGMVKRRSFLSNE